MDSRRLNIILFAIFVLVSFFFSFLPDSLFFYDFAKPWQLEPFTHEDSLCSEYKEKYEEYDQMSIISRDMGFEKTVIILVDAWGAAIDPSMLAEDYDIFDTSNVKFGIHKRLQNRNTHAEQVEYRNEVGNSVYFFGGDSMEYDRKNYIPGLGFDKLLFCQRCVDEVMLAKLDSAISSYEFDTTAVFPKMLAWTTQTSRDGNRENLHNTLAGIAKLMQKYPDMQFIVQGTHRPILGTPETRRMYHAHWVPVVVQKGKNNSK